MKVGLHQTTPPGAARAVVAHESGDKAFDAGASFTVGLELRRQAVGASGVHVGAIVADENLALGV